MTAHPTQVEVLPLRPLTAAELLDSSVALLRSRGGLLIGLGVALAAAEQAVLYPLRRLADVDLRFLPGDDLWQFWTLMMVTGFATEAVIIAALGGAAAGVAPRALLGRAAPRTRMTPGRLLSVGTVAVVVALASAAVAATSFGWPATFFVLSLFTIPVWMWVYGATGLAVPAAVTERRAPPGALARGLGLAHRGGLRAVWIRLLAYLGWVTVRLAWGFGALSLIQLIYVSPDTRVDALLLAAVFFVVNALAYPVLGCLDAVLYLEARMRTEGLDIALRRSLARGVDPAPQLVGS